jgi:UDP-N-acetylmuramate dehydrogenase
MEFDYRKSLLQNDNYVVLGAEFNLKRADKNEIKNLMDRNLSTRRNIQPTLVNPNAGSVFKNPENDSAGRLLDKAGVKDFDLENVKVWDNHANFIVNKGNATSEDVLELMAKMHNAVKEKFTIELQPEIVFIGDKTKKEDELCKILYKKIQK